MDGFDRLEAEASKWKRVAERRRKKLVAEKERADRYAAALREIAEMDCECGCGVPCDCNSSTWVGMQNIAKKALDQTSGHAPGEQRAE